MGHSLFTKKSVVTSNRMCYSNEFVCPICYHVDDKLIHLKATYFVKS